MTSKLFSLLNQIIFMNFTLFNHKTKTSFKAASLKLVFVLSLYSALTGLFDYHLCTRETSLP